MLRNDCISRAVLIGRYVAETGCTVRAAAKVFGVSKSTVHKDLSQRLKEDNKALYKQVQKVLQINKSERNLRGGIATRNKYRGLTNK